MGKALVILTLVMLGMVSCVAIIYREEIEDIQAYMSRPLIPELRDRRDLAP